MMLTPHAMELIPALRRVLSQTARIVTPSPFDPAVDRSVITVAMTTSKALVIGSTIARLIAQRAPHATLRLRATAMASSAQFTEERADVLLLSGEVASPYPREHLCDDRWVVITNSSAPRDASAAELLTTLPHVVYDVPEHRARPYEALDEHTVEYAVRARVSDNLLIPHLISDAGGVAVHRYRIATAMSSYLDLRIEEFPFPVPSLGIDMVWNPWLADDQFKDWLRGILLEAAGSL